MVETPLNEGDDFVADCSKLGSQTIDIAKIVQQELMKVLKGKMSVEIKN